MDRQEINKKISEALSGKPKSEQHKKALSESHKGVLLGRAKTQEHRDRIAHANKGKTKSEEHRRKISESRKGIKPRISPEKRAEMNRKIGDSKRGEKSHFWGRVVSEEEKARISERHKGNNYRLQKAHGISNEEYRKQIAAGNFWCSGHKQFLPNSDMSGSGKVRAAHCKDCSRDYDRKRRLQKVFGVDASWYDAKFEQQEGGCAICKSTEAVSKHGFFAVDHNHTTGALRGLLCFPCNSFVGRIESDRYNQALAYLARYATS